VQKTSKAGPIATRLVRAIQEVKSARVMDLRAFRDGMARATDLQKTVATREDLADFHPAHAVYVVVQNQVSVLVEQLTALPDTAELADRIEAAENEYMPSGPPMSPLTVSYFTSWAFFDCAVGARRETLGTCVLAVGKSLGMAPDFLALVESMQESCMRIYTHEGLNADGTTTLRDLVTGIRSTCLVPSGWRGGVGELWLARVLPPPASHLTASVVFTTPYILRGSKERDWLACLERTLGAARRDARRSTAMLKYEGDWSEYIFAGYVGHVAEAIFLTGLPDIPASLPHSSPRAR